MDFEYIIVQAGGKGTRMGYLTANKPKCLVSVNKMPVLFHLFNKYPDKKFIIIGDYKFDVLRKYLEAFAEVKYLLVNASGKKGTCAGIADAICKIPDSSPFMLVWSDLILQDGFNIPEEAGNYIGLSGSFECRWKYENGIFKEEPSVPYGVAGLFIFQSKDVIKDVVAEGEFVRWLKEKNLQFSGITLSGTKEYGLLQEYEKLPEYRCRPFNSMAEKDGCIIKEGRNAQGKKLAEWETKWYKHAQELGITGIPNIYSYIPLCMEKIDGKNIFEYKWTKNEKAEVLLKITDMLQNLHNREKKEADFFSIKEAYVTKTFARISKVRNLIPFADNKYITINGKKCRNIFFFQKEFEERAENLPIKKFCLIHGDCTFSNLMLRKDGTPVMIDPRGYFGFTELYGDSAYDWAKLYYSITGNYDQFNSGNFRLEIKEDCINLDIASSGWEDMEEKFFQLLSGEAEEWQVKFIHALIWLSLSTYAWDNYDSVCGAFYNGLFYLEEVL
ncbi:MAG: NTP transferase domain-containing protein [Lachnospiraceae bacterium]|nr:NTP transferase domain-containing protein [Lachnospiraceae bacterium]